MQPFLLALFIQYLTATTDVRIQPSGAVTSAAFATGVIRMGIAAATKLRYRFIAFNRNGQHTLEVAIFQVFSLACSSTYSNAPICDVRFQACTIRSSVLWNLISSPCRSSTSPSMESTVRPFMLKTGCGIARCSATRSSAR